MASTGQLEASRWSIRLGSERKTPEHLRRSHETIDQLRDPRARLGNSLKGRRPVPEAESYNTRSARTKPLCFGGFAPNKAISYDASESLAPNKAISLRWLCAEQSHFARRLGVDGAEQSHFVERPIDPNLITRILRERTHL